MVEKIACPTNGGGGTSRWVSQVAPESDQGVDFDIYFNREI